MEPPSVAGVGPAARQAAKPLRKRARSESDEDSGVNVNAIKELREEHKFRERSSGLDTQKLFLAQQTNSESDKPTMTNEVASGAATSGLAGFDTVGKVGIDPLEVAKQNFIQQRLKQLRGEEMKESSPVDSARSLDPWLHPSAAEENRGRIDAEELLSNPDKMYELPVHLQPLRYSRTAPVPGQGGAGSGTMGAPSNAQGGTGTGAATASGDGSGTGGIMLAGTGITEVALPAESRAKNLADTERAIAAYYAKRQQQRGAQQGQGQDEQEGQHTQQGRLNTITGSLTANYAAQRKEYAQNMRAEARDRKAAQRDADHDEGEQQHWEGMIEGGTHGEGAGLADALRPSTRPVHTFAVPTHGEAGGHGAGSGRTHASDDKAFKTFRARELGATRNK